ncbi:MAG: DUF3325 domain-containing protein [Parahaliea sp.]
MTGAHIVVLLPSLAGFVALALAMPRHSKHILRKNLTDTQRRVLRVLGWVLLTAALWLGVVQWRFDVGMVTWLGWLTVTGLALVFYLPKWPWQPAARPNNRPGKARVSNRDNDEVVTPASAMKARRSPVVHTGFAAFALLLPPGGVAWQLLNAGEKPLLRADAIHGEIGRWTFTLAEKDQKPPEVAALDVPLKAFVIRFCDGCERDIRMAYLKVRQPRFPASAVGTFRSAGIAFEGRGREKTAEIPLPRAAKLDDGLWLTVEATNGEVYHRRLDIQRLSPAMARFIRENT